VSLTGEKELTIFAGIYDTTGPCTEDSANRDLGRIDFVL
jgi:hypothetical protein